MDRKEEAVQSIERASSEGPEKNVGYAPMTAQEEKRLVRKIDWNVVPLMILFYLLSFLDRCVFRLMPDALTTEQTLEMQGSMGLRKTSSSPTTTIALR
jgi:hypothetical protein